METGGKGTYEITAEVEGIVKQSGISRGVVTVFVKHTSASLVIMEMRIPVPVATWRSSLSDWFRRIPLISFIPWKDPMTCPLIFAWP